MSKNISASNIFSLASSIINLSDGQSRSVAHINNHSNWGSVTSAQSAKSLTEEGFTKRNETENE